MPQPNGGGDPRLPADMFVLSTEVTIAAAHYLAGHVGPCEKLHGHNYRIRLVVASSRLDPLGMGMDFADLKRLLREITAPFDHRNLNEVPPFDRINPTAEHLARHLYLEAAKRLSPPMAVRRVDVFETPTTCAAYEVAEED